MKKLLNRSTSTCSPSYLEVVLRNQPLLDYIAVTARKAAHVLTVCTGSMIAAATGILDGKRATTDKCFFEQVARSRPQVNWQKNGRWVVDGKFWTSSGVSSGLDMTWAFLADRYGREIADLAAVYLEIVPITDAMHDPFAPTPTLVAQWGHLLRASTATEIAKHHRHQQEDK